MFYGKKPFIFLKAAFLILLGILLQSEHMFGVSPEAQVLVHPREIQPSRHLSGKPFVPTKPRIIEATFHKLEAEVSEKVESIPEYSPGECGILQIPDPRLPEERAKMAEAETIPPISRHPDNRISLKDEMVTLDDLDIGEKGSMVYPGDYIGKQFQGYFFIPNVWMEEFVQPYENRRNYWNYNNSQMNEYTNRAIAQLAEGVNRYTGISTSVEPNLFLSSPRLLKTPFISMSTDRSFELTKTERGNLGEYLRHGGFAFLDNAAPATEWGPAEASFKQMLRDALGSDACFQPIPQSHPVYHCFFDFTDGPPNGVEIDGFNWSTQITCGVNYTNVKMARPIPYLEGIFLDGELVAVFSNKGYSKKWSVISNNTPQLKMGVNLVVYALTREGGMNERTMEWYRIDKTTMP